MFVLLTCLLVGCCVKGNLSLNDQSNRDHIFHLEKSTVALLDRDYEEDKFRTICAGVWISPTKILTARHCVESQLSLDDEGKLNKLPGRLMAFKNFNESSEEISISNYKNQKLPHFGLVVAYDTDSDLALLESLDYTSPDYVSIYNGEIFSGMNLDVIGHPGGLEYSYLAGIVAYSYRVMHPFEKEWEMIQVSAPATFGNSGGGAFAKSGELVGICSFIRQRIPNAVFFVHRNAIKVFLEREGVAL